jgi:hypothetical protein
VQQISSAGQISYATLPNNSTLSGTVYYGVSNPTQYSSSFSSLSFSFNGATTGTTDPAPADVAPPLPTLADGQYPATFEGQSTTTGLASIQITGLPSGSQINASTATLSDVAGLEWGYGQSYARGELGLTIASSQNGAVQTITFPPYRDEAGTSMTLTFQLQGSSTEYVTDIAVPSSDHTYPNLLDVPSDGTANAYPSPWSNADPYSAPLELEPDGSTPDYVTIVGTNTSEDFNTWINSLASGETTYNSGYYNNFELTAGTYYLDELLIINYPTKLWGASESGADLEFTFQSTRSSTTGNSNPSEYFGAINIESSHVTLEDFTINFSQSNVSLGGGTVGSTQEPLGGIIDDQYPTQTAHVDINIMDLAIYGAMETQYATSEYWNDLDDDANGIEHDGYLTMPTITMGDYDSGTIENNTIYAGTIYVQWGPWTISGNQFPEGPGIQGTICLGAFGVHFGHDVTIGDNTLSDPNPAEDGQLERLMTGAIGGYNINVVGNSVSDNVGDLVNEGNNLNASEEILPEACGAIYEGSTEATTVSYSPNNLYNRTVIAIPSSELFDEVSPATGATGNPLSVPVLFILDGNSAGTAIPVTQAFTVQGTSQSAFQGTSYFVLTSPLPQGTFDFSIASAYNGFTVSGNSINTSNTVSDGVVITANCVDFQVTGNTFIGNDTTIAGGGWYSEAVRIEDNAEQPGGGVPSYESTASTPLTSAYGGNAGFYVSLVYMFGVDVIGNAIYDPLMGIDVYQELGADVPTTYGRTYVFITLIDNTFTYDYSVAAPDSVGAIHIGDNAEASTQQTGPNDYAKVVNGTVEYDQYATYFVDPRQTSVTTSGNTIYWVGVSPGADAIEVDSALVNGVLEYGATYSTPIPPLLSSNTNALLDSITVGSTVYVFVVGPNGGVYVDDGAGSSSNGWTYLGDEGSGFSSISAVNANGVPEVFGVSSSGLYEAQYKNSAWTAFSSLSSSGGLDVSAIYDSGNGYQYAFLLGSAGTVSVDTYNGTSWTWTNLPDVEPPLASISATLYDTTPEVFAVGSSGAYAAQYGNSTWSWSPVGNSGGDEVSVVFDSANSYQYAFVLGITGELSVDIWNGSWSSTAIGDDGSPITSISATVYSGNLPEAFTVSSSGVYVALLGSTWYWQAEQGGGSEVAVITDGSDQDDFVLGTSGALSVDYYYGGSSWSGWSYMGVPYSSSLSSIEAGGTTYVFTLGTNGGVSVDEGSLQFWNGPTYLNDDGAVFSSISAVSSATGVPQVFAVNPFGLYEAQLEGGAWTAWAYIGPVAARSARSPTPVTATSTPLCWSPAVRFPSRPTTARRGPWRICRPTGRLSPRSQRPCTTPLRRSSRSAPPAPTRRNTATRHGAGPPWVTAEATRCPWSSRAATVTSTLLCWGPAVRFRSTHGTARRGHRQLLAPTGRRSPRSRRPCTTARPRPLRSTPPASTWRSLGRHGTGNPNTAAATRFPSSPRAATRTIWYWARAVRSRSITTSARPGQAGAAWVPLTRSR